jgi:hypothetical protein
MEAFPVMRTGNDWLDLVIPQVLGTMGTVGILILLGSLGGFSRYATTALVWSGATALIWSGVPASDRAVSAVGRAAVVSGLVSGAISLVLWEGIWGIFRATHVRPPYDSLVSVVIPIGIVSGLVAALPGLVVSRRIGGVGTAVPVAVGAGFAATIAQVLALYAGWAPSFSALDSQGASFVTGASVAGFAGGLAMGLDGRRTVGRAVLLGIGGALLSIGLDLLIPEGFRYSYAFGFALGFAFFPIILPALMAGGISALIGALAGKAASRAMEAKSS